MANAKDGQTIAKQLKLDRPSRVSGVHHPCCRAHHGSPGPLLCTCPGDCTPGPLPRVALSLYRAVAPPPAAENLPRLRFVVFFLVKGPLKSGFFVYTFLGSRVKKCLWCIWGFGHMLGRKSKKSARKLWKSHGGQSYRFRRFPCFWGILSSVNHDILFEGPNCDTPMFPFWVLP